MFLTGTGTIENVHGMQWALYGKGWDMWDPNDPSKMIKHGNNFLQKLQAYKNRFCHVNVPIHWSENKKLAKWVACQRQLYKTGRYVHRGDQTRILNDMGCEWDRPLPLKKLEQQRQQQQMASTDEKNGGSSLTNSRHITTSWNWNWNKMIVAPRLQLIL
jgi:hypothetical protein